MKKVAVIMGSDSDLETVSPCMSRLDSFSIPYEVRIISAHRTPEQAAEFADQAAGQGFGVLIAAAGKAAHLAGILAAHTTLPVIGIPIKTSMMGGLDSLLSVVQMPKGVPVACVAVDGADNAAILAAQILALDDQKLSEDLVRFKADQTSQILEKDRAVREQYSKLS